MNILNAFDNKLKHDKSPITRLRQQSNPSSSSSSSNIHHFQYPKGDEEDDNEDDDGDDDGNDTKDDGVGPWSESDKANTNTMSSLTFHEAVNEIKSLTSAPLQPESLK